MNAITRSLGMSKQTVYARYPDEHELSRAELIAFAIRNDLT